MTVIGMLALLAVVVGAQAPKPTAVEQLTAQIVAKLLEHDHMARPKIDAETSKKWARNFLKDLDPQKNYFEKGDVDEFLAKDTILGTEVRDGNLEYPQQVFARYLERSDQRLANVQELLKKKPDFSIQETMSTIPTRSTTPSMPKRPKNGGGRRSSSSGSNSRCSTRPTTTRSSRS
jgi:carboxyl-terminal processing protease